MTGLERSTYPHPLPAWLAEALAFDPAGYTPWIAGGDRVGWVRADTIERLREDADPALAVRDGALRFDAALAGDAARTAALAPILDRLRARGWVDGWRDERYLVRGEADGAPKFSMERAAVRRFGVRGHASHLNAYVRTPRGVAFWIAERSATKQTDPGRLDNLVGGGIAAGLDARQTLVKECWEEAGLTADLVARARPAGTIRFECFDEQGVDANCVHAFDLELGAAVVPRNQDGEVARIDLVPLVDLRALLAVPHRFTIDAALATIACIARLEGMAIIDPHR